MTELVLTLDRPPRALSSGARAVLALLVLLAHVGVAWTVLRLAQAPLAVEPPKVLEVTWIAPAQPDEPAPPQPPLPAPPVTQPPVAKLQPRAAVPTPTPAPAAPAAVAAPAAPVVAPVAAPAAPVAAAPAPAAVEAAPAAPAPVPRLVASSALRYLDPLKPVYPRASTELCETGIVTLNILVNEWGVPVEVVVEKSSGYPRLDQSALTAMRAARFKPYVEAGQPRPIRAHPTINFQLDC